MAPRRVDARRRLSALLTITATTLLTAATAQPVAAAGRSVTPSTRVAANPRPASRHAFPSIRHLSWSSRDLVPTPPSPPPGRSAAPVALTLRNALTSADGTLHAAVAIYSDCTGRTPLTRVAAAIDTCIRGRTYFVGHNPGVFTPLMHMAVGSVVTWHDNAGVAHLLRIVAVRQWRSGGAPPYPVAGATVQFQTCITLDGSLDRLVDAAPA